MADENVYSPPQSDVTPTNQQTNEIIQFPRISAWAVFFLVFFTYGFYGSYWLYSRTKIVNTLPNRKLSMLPPTMMLILAAIGILLSIANIIYNQNPIISLIAGINGLINLVFYVIAVFGFRRELREILELSWAKDSKLGGIMVFFFSSIYLQYKINKCLDQKGIQ